MIIYKISSSTEDMKTVTKRKSSMTDDTSRSISSSHDKFAAAAK
jgi:hypothetical protein